MEELEKHQNEMEDLLDGIISESRKEDDEISLEEVKIKLKKKGN